MLGPVRAWHDDRAIALGPARQRAVFAALAVNAGRSVSRAELVRAVWGSSAPASADGSVQSYVSGLRRALDPCRARWSCGGVIRSDGEGYRLDLLSGQLDLRVFATLCERAHEAVAAGLHREAVRLLATALALWRGEALSGVPGPAAERHRLQLAEARLCAVESRTRALLVLGEHADAAAELTALVQAHPLREELWESLVTALHGDGRAAEAMMRWTEANAVLCRELGTTPGPALRALHRRILTHDETPAGCAGREPELAKLRAHLAALIAGRGRSVWVVGSRGSGRSSLLAALCADATRQGCAVVHGVHGVAGGRPSVVVADDLASLREWHQVRALTARRPVLAVAVVRDTTPVPSHDDLVLLRPLEPDAVSRLLTAHFGLTPDPRLLEEAGCAAGNPARLLRFLAHGTEHAAADAIAALTRRCQAVLREAARIGEVFEVDTLTAVTARPAGWLLDPLEEALSEGVLVEAGEALAFRHPALRAAARLPGADGVTRACATE